MSISQVLNCLFVCVGRFSVAKVQNNIFPASLPKFFFQFSPDFFRGTLRIKSSSSLLSNVSHVARVSKEFVLIARQCTARCSQRVAQRKCWLIDNYFKGYKDLNIAEPHVASNVRYIAFALRTNSFYITTCVLPNGNGERRTCTP